MQGLRIWHFVMVTGGDVPCRNVWHCLVLRTCKPLCTVPTLVSNWTNQSTPVSRYARNTGCVSKLDRSRSNLIYLEIIV